MDIVKQFFLIPTVSLSNNMCPNDVHNIKKWGMLVWFLCKSIDSGNLIDWEGRKEWCYICRCKIRKCWSPNLALKLLDVITVNERWIFLVWCDAFNVAYVMKKERFWWILIVDKNKYKRNFYSRILKSKIHGIYRKKIKT